ncbi:hypothetical protein RUR49_11780 [Pseudoxanthobacter sp. M-2]|uniref:hypothetical protein n=1 Tax=Pseudoxanthobacter sp. M-2 TaxID=3078754 RepID=UPI0038FCC8CA
MTKAPPEQPPAIATSSFADLYSQAGTGDRLIEILAVPSGQLRLTGAAGDDGPPEILIRLLAELAGEEPDDVVRAFGDKGNVLARVFGKLLTQGLTQEKTKKRGRGRPRDDGVRLVVLILSDYLFASGASQAEAEQRLAAVLKKLGVNKQPSQVRHIIEKGRARFRDGG